MTGEDAAEIAADVFAKANAAVKDNTGESIVAHALDIALPMVTKAWPAISIIVPIIRKIALPAIENTLSSREYVDLVLSLELLESAAADMASAATIARGRIAAMSDEEVDAWLSENDLFRKDE